jgi:hypothetical protein
MLLRAGKALLPDRELIAVEVLIPLKSFKGQLAYY